VEGAHVDRMFVLRRAEQALGSREQAGRWMETPNRAFGGQAPSARLDTVEGVKDVLAVLVRVEHGVVG
jgi:uncharacterized protein (DUF2384 family)